jgi:hypothetical protein
MRILAPLLLSFLVPVAAHADGGVTAVDDEPTSQQAAAPASAPRTRPPAMTATTSARTVDAPRTAEATRAVAASRTVDAPRNLDRRMPADVGQLRAARIDAPDAVDVDDGPGVAREHDVALAHTVSANATDGDVQAELAFHQMKRHERALDVCVAAAHRRAPALAGSVTLDFDVSDRKVRSVSVSDDSAHDAALSACLTQAARGFRFALASARFRWPVPLR